MSTRTVPVPRSDLPMKRRAAPGPLVLVLALILQAAIPGRAGLLAAPAKARISGEAFYRERVALPPAAIFEATLEDVSREDAPARVLAQVRKGRPGQVPISFEIRYDTRRLDSRRRYQVRASILEHGRVRFTGTRAYAPSARVRGTVQVLMRMTSAGEDDGRGRGEPDDRPGTGRGALIGARWTPVVIGGRPVVAPARQPEPWIEMDGASNRVTGSGGCNRITGRYAVGRGTLRFEDLVTTRMACLEMDFENAFLRALNRTREYRISGRTLELLDDRDRVLAQLERRRS